MAPNLMGTVRVEGVEKMRLLGRELRAAGEEGRGLRLQLFATIKATTLPARDAVKESARTRLPKTGGLNEWVAGSNIAVRNRLTGGRAIGVRIVGIRKADTKHGGQEDTNLWRIDRGTVRHPLFGNRGFWYDNAVAPGFFTEPLEEMRPMVTLGVIAALERTRREVEKL